MTLQVANNAFGELNADISNSATTIVLKSGNGARFPSLAGSQYFYATLIDTNNNLEIVKATARSSDTLTVVRAQDGTSGRAFVANDRIELRPVAAFFSTYQQKESSVDMNGTELILDADADTSITADTDDQIDIKINGSDQIKLASDEVVFNEQSIDVDFRVESDNDANAFFVQGSDGKIGMGISTPRNNLDFGVTSNNDHVIALRDNNTSRTILGLSNGYGVRVGAPSDGTNTENMFEVGQINSSDGTTYQNTKFAVTYAGNIGTHAQTDLIKTNGFLKVSNAFAFHGSTDDYGNVAGQNFHELNSGTGNEFILMLKNTNSGTNQQGLYIDHASGNTDNTSARFINCVNTASRFQVLGDGDVINHDNSYGGISDERIKQDIVDANSQWNDIKSIKIRNYKKKDDVRDYGDKAWSQIGVIAQELETVSPYLIKENSPNKNDILSSSEFGTLYTSDDAETKAVLYKDGDTIPEEKKVGDVKTPASKVVGDIKEEKTTVKSVKYSVLYMKAIKALQEAMTRIEILEAKVKTLEDA